MYIWVAVTGQDSLSKEGFSSDLLWISILPSYIHPEEPSTVTSCLGFKRVVTSFTPTIQGIPNSLDTMAAWAVAPPDWVIMAEARFIIGVQSGVVIWVTRIWFSWKLEVFFMSKMIFALPDRMPAEAPIPLSIGSATDLDEEWTVSGRACTMKISWEFFSNTHSMSIGLS